MAVEMDCAVFCWFNKTSGHYNYLDTVVSCRTDKFFVEHPESSEEVYVENAKKEVRTAEGNVMQFRDFVKQYKSKDIYMVNGVPMFLRYISCALRIQPLFSVKG